MHRVALAAFLLLCGCVDTVHPPPACASGVPFQNIDATYHLCLPSGWSGKANVQGTDLYLSAPLQPGATFRDNVVLIRHLAGNLTALTYVEREVIPAIPVALRNATAASTSNLTLGGEAASRVSYAGVFRSTNLTMRFEQWVVIHHHVVYEFTYTALAGTEGTFESSVEDVVNSLQFLT
ncbi:MAG: hypothetical protein ACYDBQ_10005 [Thermoplasmatota archaeon]